MKVKISKLKILIPAGILIVVAFYIINAFRENQMLKEIIERLAADSRVAEVMVTEVKSDPATKNTYTTIKFLEYSAKLKPLKPKYFTFSGNVIQFQARVIRFDNFYVKKGHPLRGKSAYLFLKAFILTDKGAETFDITKINEIPSGYEVEGAKNNFERKLWRGFWEYALNPVQAAQSGVKNAQIEAPGTRFVPGLIYTVKIEHDGGLRIDSAPLSPILKDEKVKF